jgi:hypothetical protein
MPSKKYPPVNDNSAAKDLVVKETKAQPYRRGKDRRNGAQVTISVARMQRDKKTTAGVLTPRGAIRRPSQLALARLRKLARTQKSQIAAIEMGSQEIFVGKDVVEATLKGWKKYPGQSFYFVRIGYPAVHRHRGASQAMRIRITGRIVDAEPFERPTGKNM